MIPSFTHQLAANIDFGAVGGSLLMLDLALFGLLAAHWEEAGRYRLFARQRPKGKK